MMFPTERLGDLPLEIVDGDRGSNYPNTDDFSSTGYCLFMNAGNVTLNGFSFSNVSFVTKEKDSLLRKGKAMRHDVVLTTRGTVGNLALYDESVPFDNMRINSGMVLIRADRTKLDPEFLYYSLRSPAFSNQVASLQTGSAQPQLPIRDIKHLKIPFPPIDQQKQISKQIKLLFDKIELNQRMNETLEEMVRALFRDWFVDFGPTRRQMSGATDPAVIMGQAFPPKKAAALAPLFSAKLGVDGLPDGWETRDLRSALTLNYGKSLTKKARKPGPFNVFGSGGISGTHDTALAKGPSIIVGRKGTVGSLYWTREDFFAIDTVFYVTSDFPIVYCHRLLETLGLETMNTDAAVPGLNRDNAYRQEFAFGGDDLMHAYAGFVGTLMEKSDANKKENQTLAALRDLLLPKLMSGEIRLKDAETPT